AHLADVQQAVRICNQWGCLMIGYGDGEAVHGGGGVQAGPLPLRDGDMTKLAPSRAKVVHVARCKKSVEGRRRRAKHVAPVAFLCNVCRAAVALLLRSPTA